MRALPRGLRVRARSSVRLRADAPGGRDRRLRAAPRRRPRPQLLRGRRDRSDAARPRAADPRAAHPAALRRGLPGPLSALRREPERRGLRLSAGARRPSPRSAPCAAREVTRRGGGFRDGRTEAPDVGDEARQTASPRRPDRAARHRVSAMRRADAAPSRVPALRDVSRAQGRRHRGRLRRAPEEASDRAAHAPVIAVCLFPGQGSQRVGMARDLIDAFPVARRTFEEADAALGTALTRLCLEGPEEILRLTEHAQPAILTASVATYRVLAEPGFRPVAMAGHSLGEWSALVAAGAIGLADAVVAVRERGRLMQEAVPPGEGAMAAILGLEAADVAVL